MAQEVKIAGATFSNVPSIRVPDSNDIFHLFMDTSDANAVAGDIAQGKTAYVNGEKLTGTNEGGGSITWETIEDGDFTIVASNPNYVSINPFNDPPLQENQVWRVTWNGVTHEYPTVYYSQVNAYGIGNTVVVGGDDDGSGCTWWAYQRTSTQLAFSTTDPAGTVAIKMELQQSSSATLIEKTITANGTYNASSDNADGYSSVTVNIEGGDSKNTQIASGVGRVASTSYTAVSGQTLTVSKTGTYDIYWTGYRSSTSGTNGSQLYIGSTAYGSAQTSFNSSYTNVQNVHLTNVSLTANQTITVRARSRSTSYYMYIMNLTIIEV